MNKKYFTFSNILTWIFVVFISSMLLFPGVKAGVIRGLMTIGLFQPKVPAAEVDLKARRVNGNSFFISDINGATISVADLKGKVLFINFWATWCPPCIAEMPSIEKLYGHFKKREDFMFLMVDADNDPEKSTGFMRKNSWSMPVYFRAGKIPTEYFSGTLPTTLIVDKEGRVVFKHSGTADYSNKKFRNFLEELGKK